jgi:hypothetical protein
MWQVNDGKEFRTAQEAQAYINQTDPSWHIRLRIDPDDDIPTATYQIRIRPEDYPKRWRDVEMREMPPKGDEDNENN